MRTDEEIDFIETQIPVLAQGAVQKAYVDTLSKGISVLESIDGKIYQIDPDGKKTFVKDVSPSVKVKRKMKIK